ncbi:MAG: glycosyltransferase family 39 protein [Bacteroidota bacterium]
MRIISLPQFDKSEFSIFINQHKYKIAFGIFITYLCFSLYNIGDNNLWYDEVYSIDLGDETVEYIITNAIIEDVNPPLYLIILHYWMQLFGDSEAGLRSLSATAMSLGCGVYFLFCTRFFNWQTAIFSVLLFFTSNELFYYAQEGRTFGLIIMFCVLSNYAFMNLIKNPNWKNATFLGVFNIILFYLHTLSTLIAVGQIIAIFFLAFDKTLINNKNKNEFSFLGYRLKHLAYYILSWLVFLLLFLPWSGRFFELMNKENGSFWLTRPTSYDFKKCLYEFFNTDNLFFVYLGSFLIFLALISISKKLREEAFSLNLLLTALVMGPLLMYINYEVSIFSTPIFLKRYILFTLLGLFILYAYVLSLLKIDFRIKLCFFLTLSIVTASKMHVPKESWFDFDKGVQLLKKVEGPRCYITTDQSALYAYYLDKEGIFKAPREQRANLLAQHGVYEPGNLLWVNTLDYEKYSEIYYTRVFECYYDPERLVLAELNKKLIAKEDIDIKGIHITHYSMAPPDRDSMITVLRQEILNNQAWYSQVVQKSKEWKIPVDSMVTLDAMWNYEQKYK